MEFSILSFGLGVCLTAIGFLVSEIISNTQIIREIERHKRMRQWDSEEITQMNFQLWGERLYRERKEAEIDRALDWYLRPDFSRLFTEPAEDFPQLPDEKIEALFATLH